MLWSQIKLASYDFTDLHITGEFDNPPGTGRFLRIFSCMVTYCTGTGQHLVSSDHCTTSYGARPALKEIRRTPYGAWTILHRWSNFSCAIIYTLTSKFPTIPSKKQVVKIRKIEAAPDSDGDEKRTCTRLKKNQQHLFVACHLSAAAPAKYIFLYLCCLVFRSEISMLIQYVLLQIQVASHRWQVDS